MEEIFLPSTWAKPQVWEHLRKLHPLSDISRFQGIQENMDTTTLDKWPPRNFTLQLHVFAVQWEIKMPSAGLGSLTLQGMSAQHNVQEPWKLLHHDRSRLFERATFNYVGPLTPGRTIRA
jgi:hypothetical protein